MKLTKNIESKIWKVYYTWLDAYLNGDVKTYDKYLNKDYHFIGSTNNEEFLSKEDTTNFFQETADQLAGKCDLRNENKIIEKYGKLVFITHLFDAWFKNGDDYTFYGRFRFTNALIKNKEGWRFIYQHFSTTDSKTDEGETIGFDKVSLENQELREAIKRRTFELEEKNHELEIEAALEKVRSRTMAMQNSSELAETSLVLFEQFKNLGQISEQISIGIFDDTEKTMSLYSTLKGKQWEEEATIALEEPIVMKKIHKAWKQNKKHLVLDLSGNTLKKYNAYRNTLSNLKYEDKRWVIHVAFFSKGILTFSATEPHSNETIELLQRFAIVFEQTYTRFLDLQKAEKQARESEIELALERVRARTMAMQHSDELQKTSFLLDQQVRALGIKTWGCAFNIYGEKESTEWFGNEKGVLPPYTVPRKGIFNKYYQKGQKGESLFIQKFSGKACVDHYEYMSTLPVIGEVLKQLKKNNNGFPTYQIDHVAYFKYGYLLFITKEQVPDAHDVFKRFANVFEQTYTRFLDLKKAEEQAREAQIEAALERVRSRSLAVHKSDELNDVVAVLFEKLKELKIPSTAVGIAVNIDDSKDLNAFVCGDNEAGLVITNYRLPYFNNKISRDIYNALEEQLDFYVGHYSKKVKNSFYEYVLEHTAEFKHLPEDIKRMIFESPSYTISMVATKHSVFNINDFEGKILAENDIDIIKRFAKVFEQAYTRFLDLKKAEAQAREAQIENALEKVRSRTMAMQHSNELPEAANVLFTEVQNLGIPAWSCGYNILSEDKKSCICIMSSEGEIQSPFVLPLTTHKSLKPWHKAIINNEPFFVYEQGGKDLVEHYNFMQNLPDLKETFQQLRDADISLPTFQVNHLTKFTHGFLLFITYERVPDAHDIFQRFAKVFNQTYTRFLDLKKAEAQAREAQIEAALERVRSRSMAMHSSEELLEVIKVIADQLTRLNIKYNNVSFGSNILSDDIKFWISAKGVPNPLFIQIPNIDNPAPNRVREAEKKGIKFFADMLTTEENKQWLQHVIDYSDIKLLPQNVKEYILSSKGFARSTFILNSINLYVGNYRAKPYTDDENEIIGRFTQVFEQAYTRFLDLQKAEAQAKEAQIEAALERVRAKAMAMHNSKDISAATVVVFNELGKLGIELERCGIIIFNDPPNMEVWSTPLAPENNASVEIVTGNLDTDIHPLLQGAIKAWANKEDYYSYELQGKEVKKYYDLLEKAPDYRFPKVATYPERQIINIFYFKEGGIFLYQTKVLSEETKRILNRFTNVFSLTYRRYLDIVRAEAQARDAIKRASLDRVRGEIASMRSTQDLHRITPLIFDELTKLGVPFIRCGVFIINEAEENVEVYLSAPDGQSLGVLNLAFGINTLISNLVRDWRNGKIYHEHWDRANFISWMNSMMALGQVQNKETYQGAQDPPETLDLHFIPFDQGMLYVGNENLLDKESIALTESLAKAFAMAYSRYEDFTKLEHAKQSIENTLTELKATQSQLIQSEKMASLGELTAGIAHEIQNPLNFVNNFSEVSNELIDEMTEEIEKGDMEEVKFIVVDIKQNLEKINHHGKRADAIVKGMLQHSRSSSSTKEPTDINKLADEYLRLAYHGLRAKDKSFNATMETDFDGSLPLVNVVPQDIGRVILNLITNAFYAATLPPKGGGKDLNHKPTIWVSTKRISPLRGDQEGIEIRVKDNGPGIPEEILDKIFQPFFTTKPTGQGTGLGLSMSYDIIKAHGGELKVETKEGEARPDDPVGRGTEFIIQLPTV
ncbi:nuclear transport factor 2 family protein [Flavobacteriaceae bacterium F89]|uniref:histidine kinase n=1 Tax=Cerina litoralis TaxID=2874477 RepID=A0AAE3ESA2_9FLAO|nr:ATP-binding protein [Cerina litoralis]MCG2459244.1 nuclear transport factor 2 family protein [Cerina litoralis]